MSGGGNVSEGRTSSRVELDAVGSTLLQRVDTQGLFRAAAGLLLVVDYAARSVSLSSASSLLAALTCALGAAVGLAVWPRTTAVALWLSNAVLRQVSPARTLDDDVANVVVFWLLLLPPGSSWPFGRVAPGDRPRPLVDGAVLAAAGVFVWFWLSWTHGGAGASPASRLAMFIHWTLLLAPIGAWRVIALAPAVVAAWEVAAPGQLLVGFFTFVTCVALTLGAARGSFDAWRVGVLDTRSAMAVLIVAVMALHAGAASAGVRSVERATGRVLATAGVGWPSRR